MRGVLTAASALYPYRVPMIIASPAVPRSRPRVFLADDDEMHSEMMAVYLGFEGFEVVQFPSGDDLIAWSERTTGDPDIDALLLDVEMPGRDGFDTRKALQADPRFRDVPTLMVSGMCPETLESRARAAGVSALCKDAEVLARVSAWLGSAVAAAA